MENVATSQRRIGSARVSRALAGWVEADITRALHPIDRDVVRSTEAARSLVLDLFDPSAPARDLFNACARLGGLMAEAGASPSLAAGVIDTAVQALIDASVPYDRDRLGPARASVLEGFVAVVRDREHATALASWEYPRCVVPIDDGLVAIACGYPTEDAEALAAWAARVAGKLVKAKVRTVRVSGNAPAIAEIESAVTLVGITVSPKHGDEAKGGQATTASSSGRSWLRLPWRR
jgi:hypothetical protein